MAEINYTSLLRSTAADNKLAKTDQIYDDGIGVFLNEINARVNTFNTNLSIGKVANGKIGDSNLPVYVRSDGLLIASTSNVGAANSPTYLKAGVITEVSSLDESKISWGTVDKVSSFSPVDAGISSPLGANRFAGIKSGVSITYSNNGGSLYAEYFSDNNELLDTCLRLFNDKNNSNPSLVIGKKSTSNVAGANDRLMITIDCNAAGIYTLISKFVIYCSTNGSLSSKVTIECATTKAPSTWIKITEANLSGWSGYNVINSAKVLLDTSTTRDTAGYYRYIRFIFEGGTNSTTTSSGLQIYKIFAYGGVGWSTPSTQAKIGSTHSVTGINGEVQFPSTVTASLFIGPATKLGTATVGSSVKPVYLNAGTPTACTGINVTNVECTKLTATNIEVTPGMSMNISVDGGLMININGSMSINTPMYVSSSAIVGSADSELFWTGDASFSFPIYGGLRAHIDNFSSSTNYKYTPSLGENFVILDKSIDGDTLTILKPTKGWLLNGVYKISFIITDKTMLGAGGLNLEIPGSKIYTREGRVSTSVELYPAHSDVLGLNSNSSATVTIVPYTADNVYVSYTQGFPR